MTSFRRKSGARNTIVRCNADLLNVNRTKTYNDRPCRLSPVGRPWRVRFERNGFLRPVMEVALVEIDVSKGSEPTVLFAGARQNLRNKRHLATYRGKSCSPTVSGTFSFTFSVHPSVSLRVHAYNPRPLCVRTPTFASRSCTYVYVRERAATRLRRC